MSSTLKHSQRRFIIFDQPGGRTRPMFGSISPVHLKQPSSVCNFQEDPPLPLPVVKFDVKEKQSDETTTSKGHKVDDIQEDTEEIDALLYSDSEDEEEASSGYHSPVVSDIGPEEDVVSSGTPVKKRRLNDDTGNDGASLQDTASSADSHDSGGTGVDISHAGKLSKDEKKSPKEDNINISIHETLGILRRIIPDGAEGKNATRVIDEAISYLMFLKGCI